MKKKTAETLYLPEVTAVLDELHQKAKGDVKSFVRLLPNLLVSFAAGKTLAQAISPEMMRDAYIPVNREQGNLLYSLAIASDAKLIVEFGSSFGISTIYLAAAAKDISGKLITTEILPHKCTVTRENLKRTNLDSVAEVWEGDALVTLRAIQEPVDFLFLDGAKDLYCDILSIMLPKLKTGAIVIADNIDMGKDMKIYMEKVQAANSGFITTILNKNTALSVYTAKEGAIL